MSKLKIAVLFGGKSAEHEVSVHSAQTVCSLLNKDKYQVFPLYIKRNGEWLLADSMSSDSPNGKQVLPCIHGGHHFRFQGEGADAGFSVDAVFPVLHGSMGEDGTVQGLLELMGLPYVGCGVMASSVGMDKEVCKRIAALEGLPVLDSLVIDKDTIDHAAIARFAEKAGYPVFVKPVCQGSSVGVTKVSGAATLRKAVENALRFDTRVMIEKGVDRAREAVCGLLGEGHTVKASVCGEVRPHNHDFFDYDAKYQDAAGFDFVIPAEVSDKMSDEIRDAARKIFNAIGGSGIARADFLITQDGSKFYFCEINTLPGFTSHSLYPTLWKKTGVAPENIVDELVSIAIQRHENRKRLEIAP